MWEKIKERGKHLIEIATSSRIYTIVGAVVLIRKLSTIEKILTPAVVISFMVCITILGTTYIISEMRKK